MNFMPVFLTSRKYFVQHSSTCNSKYLVQCIFKQTVFMLNSHESYLLILFVGNEEKLAKNRWYTVKYFNYINSIYGC